MVHIVSFELVIRASRLGMSCGNFCLLRASTDSGEDTRARRARNSVDFAQFGIASETVNMHPTVSADRFR